MLPRRSFLGLVIATGAMQPFKAAVAQEQLSNIVVAYQPGDVNSQGLIKESGWFSEIDGITVEYKNFNSGADVYRAMASGAVDLGLIGNAPFSIAVSQGAPYTAVWWYVIGMTAEGLVARNTSPIKALADLEGHRIATPFGSTSDYMLHGTLAEAGFGTQDVRLINLAPQAILAAWQRGDIDAAYIWEPILSELAKQDGTVIAYNQDLLERGYIAGNVGFVKTSLLRDHPDVVRAWMEANIRAMDFIQDQPEEAHQVASTAYGVAVENIRAAYEGAVFPTGEEQLNSDYLSGLGDQLYGIATLLAAAGLIPQVADPEVYKSAVSLEPLKQALAQ